MSKNKFISARQMRERAFKISIERILNKIEAEAAIGRDKTQLPRFFSPKMKKKIIRYLLKQGYKIGPYTNEDKSESIHW